MSRLPWKFILGGLLSWRVVAWSTVLFSTYPSLELKGTGVIKKI